MSLENVESLVFNARVAEQAERYTEMVDSMKKVVELLDRDLDMEERNLLSVSYKNYVSQLRRAWRTYQAIETSERSTEQESDVAKDLKHRVEQDINQVCHEIIDLLDNKLVPRTQGGEAKVFYLKMKGDYFRYLAEIKSEADRNDVSDSALNAYKAAIEVAETDLACTHPIRLGLALNFSVFYYEIMQDSEKACSLAKEAFNSAIERLSDLEEDSYKDSTLIMQLLRDNLTLWTSEQTED